jgi:hypothetical protein
MAETQQAFDCKEPDCDAKVIYEPMSVVTYRGSNDSQKTSRGAVEGRVIRVYLRCSRNHLHDYAVRT